MAMASVISLIEEGCRFLSQASDGCFDEIIPFEEELGPVALGTGVGEAVPHIQLGRMPSLAILGIGVEREVDIPFRRRKSTRTRGHRDQKR